ncbi:MAG TPA: SDR family oxidoreductase [Longimicrobiales bacterium]
MNAASFHLAGRTAVITGGYGVLGGCIADGLAAAGARIIVLGRRMDAAEQKAAQLRSDGADALAVAADVLDEAALRRAADDIGSQVQGIDILINAAGGNVARARNDDRSIFDVAADATDEALRLNLHGTLLPSLVFGARMAQQRSGCIVNISSMAATRVLSGVLGYSMAKAAVENFTRWLAVDLARRYGEGMRVNAVAPGFFVTQQNRAVMLNEDGSYTERAERVVAHTPMGRLGRPEELVGAVQWLCSDAATFVTGAVVPVDGGFSLYSGV